MKIAVTYENGQIFQHFGHTEQFKVYEIEDNPTPIPARSARPLRSRRRSP